MAYVAAQRGTAFLELLDLAVDGEELLDERAPEVQEGHLEGLDSLDIKLASATPFAQEPTDDRGDLDCGSRLLAALDARLETDRRREALKLGEVRAIAEGVHTPASADGLRVGANEVEPRYGGDLAVQLFHRPVDRPFVGQRRLDRGIDEEVDVLGEAVEQVPSLREAGAALEDGPFAECHGDRAQDLRDPEVLLDEGLRQRGLRCCGGQEGGEVGVLREPHRACHARALGSAAKTPKSNLLIGLRLFRRS
jgi:hypothetical protein